MFTVILLKMSLIIRLKKPYPSEEDTLVWNINQMNVSISFTNHQKLSSKANVNGINISF